ncbi:LOW QUALITY PROTEIN: neurotensin receptor type 2 [Lagenorhynchus albirostris]|uniref:LOW QUALITY PROTEIN: neurotensin receptor type 2 n=1 Tax=Lagenorhynchus albirostris TaxID=27610 RepID=UPI0028EAC238|nr:LOW QUALITY PROTEIN: neurotensin receptor type 2 [Lagenorhynchus albirostris]
METSSPRPPGPSPGPALGLDARLGVDTRLWAKVLFTALYSLIFALGTAGNALSAHVVLKARAGPPGRLRCHVLSLALSALLLLLVGVPMELYNFVWFHYPWVFGDLGCRAYYFVRELCAYATVLSVASLSAERCLAVCQPLRARSLLTPRRTRRLLSLVWAASLGLALPMAIVMGQKHELETAGGQPEPASLVCTVLVSRTTLQIFIQVNVLASFVLPLALTAFLSGVTVSHLEALCSQGPSPSATGSSAPSHLKLMSEERRTLALGGQAALVRHKDSRRIRGLQRSIQVLRAIVAVYVVCWMPYHARRLMYCYVPDNGWTDKLYDFYHYFYMVTNTLFYVSSAVTPVLYNAVSSSFRKLFLEALSSLCREHHPTEPFPPGPRSPVLVDTASGPGAPPGILAWMKSKNEKSNTDCTAIQQSDEQFHH